MPSEQTVQLREKNSHLVPVFMAVSRLQEWRFHLVGTKRGYHSSLFLYISKI